MTRWTQEQTRAFDLAHEHARRVFLETPEALAYAETRGLKATAGRLGPGFWNGSFSDALPSSDTELGRTLRLDLQHIGILDRRGHEFFQGCLTFPLTSLDGTPGLVGRSLAPKRKNDSPYRNLRGQTRAYFHLEALEHFQEIIVVEGVFDAIAFIEAGFENVIALLGLAFPPELTERMQKLGVQNIVLAFDGDQAGRTASDAIAPVLVERGLNVRKCDFPKGMDPAEYAQKLQPAAKSLRFLIDHAKNLTTTDQSPASPSSEDSPSTASNEPAPPLPVTPTPKPPSLQSIEPNSTVASNQPALPQLTPEGVELRIAERWYRLRGLENNKNLLTLTTQITVTRGDARFVDRLDLSLASQRERFERQASAKLSVDRAVIESDLDQILPLAENLVTRHVLEVLGSKGPKKVEMTPEEREEGRQFLSSPNLVQQILEDYRTLGVVGEEANKLLVYLGAVSRHTKDPLLIVFSSASGAGKTAIVKATTFLMPEEDVINLSAVTKQAFFYMDPTGLKNRILVIMEEEGAEPASYSLKLLVSEKALSIAVPVRDPNSGETRTVVRVVEGPCTIFVTTTKEDCDEEFMNRAIELTINESVEQTLAILAMQKHQETLDGLIESRKRDKIARRHRNAQRLLRPLHVVNPFAQELEFPGEWLRSRREQPKFLSVARAVSLLKQFQRETKTHALEDGSVIEYIEVTRSDMELTRRLLRDALPMGADELSPQTRKLLLVIEDWVDRAIHDGANPEQVRFTRKDIWRHAKWTPKQVRTHMNSLVELEYIGLSSGRQGVTCRYELLDRVGKPSFRVGDKKESAESATSPHVNTDFAQRESHFAPTLPTPEGKDNAPLLQARFSTVPTERERARPRPRIQPETEPSP